MKFSPYYQMALQGKNNVYAAVSLARGDRALYFSAPVFLGASIGTDAVGAVVARTGLQKVDELLRGRSAQQLAGEELAAYSNEQQAAAGRKSELSAAGLQMKEPA